MKKCYLALNHAEHSAGIRLRGLLRKEQAHDGQQIIKATHIHALLLVRASLRRSHQSPCFQERKDFERPATRPAESL